MQPDRIPIWRGGSTGPEGEMSEQNYEKDFGPVDAARERTGLYALGFDPASMKGFILPFLLVGPAIVAAILIARYL